MLEAQTVPQSPAPRPQMLTGNVIWNYPATGPSVSIPPEILPTVLTTTFSITTFPTTAFSAASSSGTASLSDNHFLSGTASPSDNHFLSGTFSSSGTSSSDDSSGMGLGVKVALGVGIPLVLICVALCVFFFLRHRWSKKNREAENGDESSTVKRGPQDENSSFSGGGGGEVSASVSHVAQHPVHGNYSTPPIYLEQPGQLHGPLSGTPPSDDLGGGHPDHNAPHPDRPVSPIQPDDELVEPGGAGTDRRSPALEEDREMQWILEEERKQQEKREAAQRLPTGPGL